VPTQANPGRAATTIIDGLYARSTFGPMIVPGELAEIDIPGATAWWTSPGLAASGPTSKGLRVADGGALVEISCSAPAEDSPDEVGAWATTIAEGLEPVADQAAFRAAMGRRGVTVTDD
jgi:hypothetical protein